MIIVQQRIVSSFTRSRQSSQRPAIVSTEPFLCRQSVDYARAWVERGLPGRLLPVAGADHFTILESLADPDGALTQALVAMAEA
jgi:hypothetical protein